MKYATGCSGIEAPSVAWDSLGFSPAYSHSIYHNITADMTYITILLAVLLIAMLLLLLIAVLSDPGKKQDSKKSKKSKRRTHPMGKHKPKGWNRPG